MTPEELKTKPWYIRIEDEEHSKRVQQRLFEAGIFWYTSDKNEPKPDFLSAPVLTNATVRGEIPGYIMWSSDSNYGNYGCEKIILGDIGTFEGSVGLVEAEWKILVEGEEREKLIQTWLAERGLHFYRFLDSGLGRYWLIKNGTMPLYWKASGSFVDLPEIKFNFKTVIESVDIPVLETPQQKELKKLIKQRDEIDAKIKELQK